MPKDEGRELAPHGCNGIDPHVTRLFKIDTRERLVHEAGFAVSKKTYPVRDDARSQLLWVGVVGDPGLNEATFALGI